MTAITLREANDVLTTALNDQSLLCELILGRWNKIRVSAELQEEKNNVKVTIDVSPEVISEAIDYLEEYV